MTWLTEIIEQHSELESPESFWRWSALAAISAVVKDNIWFDKHLYKLYPNIYVMLHADSGLKKGPPISMASQLVSHVNNTNIIIGRSSIQGILKDMSTNKTTPGGTIINNSKAFICSSELTSSLIEDRVATTILTDLYDRQWRVNEWKSLLKMEVFTLKDPIITMLGGTNEAHSEEFFVKQDLYGGFFGRTFIIHESERLNTNSLMFPLKHKIDYKQSAEYLKEVAKLRGEFIVSDETRKFMDDWYIQFKAIIDQSEVKDNTGTLNRFDDSVLKVAMLISLAKEPKLELGIDSIEEAIVQCSKLLGNVRKATARKGKSIWTQEIALIIEELIEREPHMITRTQLNRKYMMHASDVEWDGIMKSLETGGVIRIEAMGSNIVYVMSDNEVMKWKEHFAGKMANDESKSKRKRKEK